jgi:hypothetical protein
MSVPGALTLDGRPLRLSVVQGAGGAGQRLGVELAGAAGACLSAPAPITLRLRRRDGAMEERRAGYSSVERRANGLLCRGAVALPGGGVRVAVEDHYTQAANGPHAAILLDRRVLVHGADPAWAGFATAFELHLGGAAAAGERRWFAPGVFYQRNQDAPPGAIGAGGPGEPMLVREDRLSLPLIAQLAPGGWWAALLHLDGTAATAAGDDLAEDLTAAALAFGAFGDPGRQVLAFTYPGSEGPVSYPPMWTQPIANRQADSPVDPFGALADTPATTGWTRRWHPLAEGQPHRYRLLLAAGRAGSYADFQRAAWRTAFEQANPRPRPARLREVELASLELLAASVVRDRGARQDAGPVGVPTWVDCFSGTTGRLQDSFSVSTVGRNLEVAQVLLVGAEREARPDWRRLAEAILRFWVDEGGHGLTHTDYDRRSHRWLDGGSGGLKSEAPPSASGGPGTPSGSPVVDGAGRVVFLRDQSEAHLAALRCHLHEARHGRRHDDWLEWCVAYGDWLAGHRTPSGLLARSYRLDGTVADPSEHDGIHAATFLAELSAATGTRRYLELALDLASRCWQRFHADGRFVGGTLDNPDCCDREAGTVALEAYLTLFEHTQDTAWVERAVRAADFTETWLVCWDIPIRAAATGPGGGPAVFFDEHATTVGLALVTLGFSAADTYLARHVRDFRRLAEITGDAHYHRIAELVLHNTKQMVQRDHEFGYARPGLQIEHWSLGRGRGSGLNSGWLPWVSTSHLLGIWS